MIVEEQRSVSVEVEDNENCYGLPMRTYEALGPAEQGIPG